MIIELKQRKLLMMALLVAMAVLAPLTALAAAQLSAVELTPSEDAVEIQLLANGEFNHRTFRMNNPPRLVVDLLGTTNQVSDARLAGDGQWVKAIRTSQFANEPQPITRVVFDLASDRSLQVTRSANGVRVAGGNAPTERESYEMRQADLANDPSTLALIGVAEDLTVEDMSTHRAELAQSDHYQDPADLDQVAETERREDDASYARTMTINLQNADIKTILRSISDFSGRNVIASPTVEGQVTVSLRNVPWREALSVILRAHGFGFVEENGIIRVDTAEALREAKLLEKSADRRSDELEALVTRIVPVDFANAEEIKDSVKEVLTQRGSVQVDTRTNSLIVNDIPASVDAVAELTRELDSRTPQVHIDALLVDIDSRKTQEIGVKWNIGGQVGNTDIVGHPDLDNPDNFPTGDFVTERTGVLAGLTDPVGEIGVVGRIDDFGQVHAALQMLARNNAADIISNPRITTTDNREANILVGKKIPLITQDMAGNSVTRMETIGIRLIVTPHINSDSQITLDVHPEVSDLASQATVQGGVIINTSEADTRVLVGNRETAVIGGLIRNIESSLVSGVPVLKDIPLIGALFRSKSTNEEQRELLVFLTPTIVEDEGIGTEREFDLKNKIDDRIGRETSSSD